MIEKNHRIAQMILEKVAYPTICEVSQMLPTERGAKRIWPPQDNKICLGGGGNLIGPSHPRDNYNNNFTRICNCPPNNELVNKCVCCDNYL